jgi:2Fe-2S ferredoxin
VHLGRRPRVVYVTYVRSSGERRTVDVAPGVSVMEGAQQNRVPEVESDCGGACTCATCHVYVDPAWVGRLAPVSKQENLMLALVEDRRETSRLSCQIKMVDDLDGLVVWTIKPVG